MNATESRRRVQAVDGVHLGYAAEVSYAPHRAILRRNGVSALYERSGSPVERGGVWYHYYTEVEVIDQ